MVKNSKTVKKNVAAAKKDVKLKNKTKSGPTPAKNVEKILDNALDSKVEYAYEDDSKAQKSDKSSKSGKDKPKPKPTKVEQGHLVSVEYVGKLKSGEEFDNSKTHGPIQFVVGNGQVIKGFDKAVLGMKINDKKKFTIPKVDAYGDANPALIQPIPLNKVPEHIKSQLKVGGFLVMQSPVGQQVPAKVVKLDKDNVHLDMNHPLAGQDLTFEIKLVDINYALANSGCGDGSCGDDCKDDCGDDCGCGHDHK